MYRARENSLGGLVTPEEGIFQAKREITILWDFISGGEGEEDGALHIKSAM